MRNATVSNRVNNGEVEPEVTGPPGKSAYRPVSASVLAKERWIHGSSRGKPNAPFAARLATTKYAAPALAPESAKKSTRTGTQSKPPLLLNPAVPCTTRPVFRHHGPEDPLIEGDPEAAPRKLIANRG